MSKKTYELKIARMLSFSGFYVKDRKSKRIDQTELKSVWLLIKPLKY